MAQTEQSSHWKERILFWMDRTGAIERTPLCFTESANCCQRFLSGLLTSYFHDTGVTRHCDEHGSYKTQAPHKYGVCFVVLPLDSANEFIRQVDVPEKGELLSRLISKKSFIWSNRKIALEEIIFLIFYKFSEQKFFRSDILRKKFIWSVKKYT